MTAAAELPRQQIGHGLGASEVAAALGLSPYKTQLELWLEKTGQRAGFEGNDRTEWGTDVEPALRNWYVRRHNLAVWVPTSSLYHKRHAFLRATPDGIALDESRPESSSWDHGFEAKNVGRRSAHRWGEPGTDDVPREYLLQAQQNMAVTELDRWVLVASIAGDPPAEYVVTRDDDLIEDMIQGAVDFWKLVESGTPPPIDSGEEWARYLAERHPFSREDLKKADPEDERNIIELREVRFAIRELEGRKGLLENLLKASIGDRAGLESAHGRITWKPSQGRTSIDWEAVARAFAAGSGPGGQGALQELVAEHTTQGKPGRPFLAPRAWSKE